MTWPGVPEGRREGRGQLRFHALIKGGTTRAWRVSEIFRERGFTVWTDQWNRSVIEMLPYKDSEVKFTVS